MYYWQIAHFSESPEKTNLILLQAEFLSSLAPQNDFYQAFKANQALVGTYFNILVLIIIVQVVIQMKELYMEIQKHQYKYIFTFIWWTFSVV